MARKSRMGVLNRQRELQDELEAQPVAFFMRRSEALLDEAHVALGSSIGADAENLVFVPNATTAVNAYVRPVMEGYLESMHRGLHAQQIDAPLLIMHFPPVAAAVFAHSRANCSTVLDATPVKISCQPGV